MLRAALVSIVLTLAAPPASVLCQLWCHPAGQTTNACSRHGQDTDVRSPERCGAALDVPRFIREVVPDATASSDATHAVPVPRYLLAGPARARRNSAPRERAWALATRPLETTLRL